MSDLERFKRRLIRSVARLLLKEKKTPDEVWTHLSKETGRDTKELWKRMSILCLKKLTRLLAVDDYVARVGKVARMSITDWLMFDMVLVHRKPDVISYDIGVSDAKPTALEDLFELVQKYNVEELVPGSRELAETWAEIAKVYNSWSGFRYYKGKTPVDDETRNAAQARECSPILLQLRWYQMKETTRASFYKLWYKYRGNMRNLQGIDSYLPTPLQSAIAKRYPSIVTTPFPTWEDLIEEQHIVLFDQFQALKKSLRTYKDKGEEEQPATSSEPDLVVIEPKIDVITVDDNSDDEIDTPARKDPSSIVETPEEKSITSLLVKNNESIEIMKQPMLGVKVKQEPVDDITEVPVIEDVDGLSNVMILDAIHVPTEEIDGIDETNEIDEKTLNNESEKAAKEFEVLNQTNIHGYVDSSPILELSDDIDDIIMTNVSNIENTAMDGGFVVSNNSVTSINKTSSQDTHEVVKDNVQFHSESQSLDTIKRKEVIHDIKVANQKEFHVPLINTLNELPSNLELIDDGIDLCDEEDDIITFQDETVDVKQENKDAIDSDESHDNEAEENAKFDLKLMMLPVVYTTKLDQMEIFQDADYESIKTVEVINSALLESKPVSSKAIFITPAAPLDQTVDDDKKVLEDIIQFEPNLNESSSDSDCIIPDSVKVALNNPIFKKPRLPSSGYNCIVLCKNPDFNTRLKKLSPSFFLTKRNCRLLNACKPMTIDLHKSFETKLIDNTIYLKSEEAGSDKVKCEEKQSNNQTISIMPSALPAQCLVDKTKKDNIQHLIPPPQTYEASQDNAEDDLVAERKNKVINLPDIVKVRRINQHLLTAEVSPIQAWKSDTDEIEKKIDMNIIDPMPAQEESKPNTCVESKVNETDHKVVSKPLLSMEVSPLYLNKLPKAHHLQHVLPDTSRGPPTVTCLNVESVATIQQKITEKLKKTNKSNKKSRPAANCPRVPWYVSGPARPPVQSKVLNESILTNDSLMKMLHIMGLQYSPENTDKTLEDVIDLDEPTKETKKAKPKSKRSKSNNASGSNNEKKRAAPKRRKKKQTVKPTEILSSEDEVEPQRALEQALTLIQTPKKQVITRIVGPSAVKIAQNSCVSLVPKSDLVIPSRDTSTPVNDRDDCMIDFNESVSAVTTSISIKPTHCDTVSSDIAVQTEIDDIQDKLLDVIDLNTAPKETENSEADNPNSSDSNYIILSDEEGELSKSIPGHINNLIVQNEKVLSTGVPVIAPPRFKKKYVITCRRSLSNVCPLHLGKDQILLTTATIPPYMMDPSMVRPTPSEIDKPPVKNSVINANPLHLPTSVLPQGVNLLLMPNGDLNADLDDNVNIDANKLNRLAEDMSKKIPNFNVNFGNIKKAVDNEVTKDKERKEEVTSTVTETAETPLTPGISSVGADEAIKNVDEMTTYVDGPKTIADKVTEIADKAKEIDDDVTTIDDAPKTTVDDVATISEAQETMHVTTQSSQQSDLTETTPKEDATATNQSDARPSVKKSILSDLMEMSGISPADAQPEPNTQTDKLNLEDPTATIMLTQVTSVKILKYAREQNAQFFKFNFVTGVVSRVVVTIEKKNPIVSPKPGPLRFRPIQPSPVIDLTDKVESTQIRNNVAGTMVKGKNGDTLVPKIVIDQSDPNTETYFPKILRKKTDLLLAELRARAKLPRRRKQKIEAKIYLDDSDAPMEEEYLVDSDSDGSSRLTPGNESLKSLKRGSAILGASHSNSSDDEPLAKKVNKIRNNVLLDENSGVPAKEIDDASETVVDDVPETGMDVEPETGMDDVFPQMEDISEPENEMEPFPIERLEDEDSQNSDECILGA